MQHAEMSLTEMEWRLRNAAWRGDVATVRALVSKGVDVNAKDPLANEWTALNRAVSRGHTDVVRALIDGGADLNTRGYGGGPPLRRALFLGDSDVVHLLATARAEVTAAGNPGWTPLHRAVYDGNSGMVQVLINAGANLDARADEQGGETALHIAASRGHDNIVAMLLSAGADPTARDKAGETPLPQLAQRGLLMALWRLLDKGVEMDSATKKNLVAMGGSQALEAFEACMEQWRSDSVAGREPTELPIEVFKAGPESVRTYIRELAQSTKPHYRHRLCVMGPSTWGKTSLVKSLARSECVLEQSSTRTVGIDLFPWRFERTRQDGHTERHEVTFWDLAGQDVYHNVHQVFFSPRTLFLMVIDLKAYADALLGNGMRGSNVDDRLTRFFDEFILPWLSMVYTRLPDANIVFVGTKKDDLVTSVDEIQIDLGLRIGQWLDQRLEKVEEGEPTRLDRSRWRNLLATALTNWITMTNTDITSVKAASDALQAIVLNQRNGFCMPDKYMMVLNCVRKLQHREWNSRDLQLSKMFMSKADACKLVQYLCHPLYFAACTVIMRTLGELGDVLWYADDHAAPALRSQMCFSPTLVINLIREVVCHELLSLRAETTSIVSCGEDPSCELDECEARRNRFEAYELIRTDPAYHTWIHKLQDGGQIDACLLQKLPMWKDLAHVHKGQCLVALKQLLHHLGLAYPVDQHEITVVTDLIVPAYWQMKEEEHDPTTHSSKIGDQAASIPTSLTHKQSTQASAGFLLEFWVRYLPKTLFEQIAVRSWSSDYSRVVASPKRVVDTSTDGDQVEIAISDSSGKRVIRVTALAQSSDSAQTLARHHYDVIASVLTEYPGLDVAVCSIDADGYEEDIEGNVGDTDAARSSDRGASAANSYQLSHRRVKLSRAWLSMRGQTLVKLVEMLIDCCRIDDVSDDEINRAEWLATPFNDEKCIALQALFEVGETIESLFDGVVGVPSVCQTSIEACWECWLDDKRHRRELTVIPPLVFDHVAPLIRTYARELAMSKQSCYWHNVCVIEPTLSSANKKASVAETEVESDPLVGVYLASFDASSKTGASETHGVAIWHYRGQDLFDIVGLLSRRSFFLLAVDLDACANDLKAAGAARDQRNAVVEEYVVRHVRALVSRFPTTDIRLIGKTSEHASDTTQSRYSRKNDTLQELVESCRQWRSEGRHQLSYALKSMYTSACVVSTIDSCSTPTILSSIRNRLARHESGYYRMPDSFSVVLRLYAETRECPSKAESACFKRDVAALASSLSESEVDMVIKCHTNQELSGVLTTESSENNLTSGTPH